MNVSELLKQPEIVALSECHDGEMDQIVLDLEKARCCVRVTCPDEDGDSTLVEFEFTSPLAVDLILPPRRDGFEEYTFPRTRLLDGIDVLKQEQNGASIVRFKGTYGWEFRLTCRDVEFRVSTNRLDAPRP